LIDNVFVNSILLNFDTGIIYSDISDHLPIVLHVNIVIKKKGCIPVIKRMYSPQLITKIKVSLADTNDILLQTRSTVNPNSPYAMFIEKYTTLFEKKNSLAIHQVLKEETSLASLDDQGSHQILL